MLLKCNRGTVCLAGRACPSGVKTCSVFDNLGPQRGEAAPFLEILQDQVNAWGERSKPLSHRPVPKINLICGPA